MVLAWEADGASSLPRFSIIRPVEKQTDPVPILSVDYNALNQIHFLVADVTGNCDISLSTPNVVAVVELMRQGNVVETVNLPVPRRDQTALSGQATLSIDDNGLLNITLKPSCTQQQPYRIEK